MANSRNIEEIIENYNSKIQGVIRKFSKSENDVEDIKQEVYIKTWKNLSKFKEQSNYWGLLNRITVNTCIDHFRINKKRMVETCPEQEMIENIPSKQTSIEKKAIFTERHRQILKSINKLNPKLKEVIILHDIEDLTYEKIAQKVNCPVGTVKSRLFNARKTLKEDLQELLH